MPILLDMSLKDWFDMNKREEESLRQWESERKVKRCKSCGQPYSYEKGSIDPRECQSCRGEEGELIY